MELYYTKLDNNGNNIVFHEWITPPYEFGNHEVNVDVQKTYPTHHSNTFRYLIYKKYGIAENSFVKIINHSTKPIEYFIAGTQNLVYGDCDGLEKSLSDGCDCNLRIVHSPRPIFNNAPIYYLLHPDRKVNVSNLQVLRYEVDNKYSCYETGISFINNKVGNVTVNIPYTLSEVTKLYRNEYAGSKDTILYLSYLTKHQNTRLKNWPIKIPAGAIPIADYYGVIGPGVTFQSVRSTPVLNIPDDLDYNGVSSVDDIEPDKW